MFKRAKQLFLTLAWLTPLAGNLISAFKLAIRRRKDPYEVLMVKYGGEPLFFRGIDSNALVEVIHEREYSFLTDEIRKKSAPRILDVGAHIGTFAAWALATNPNAEILSVEADKETFAVATRNANYRSGNWQVINFAASATDGSRLRFSTSGPSMSHKVSPDGDVEVETTTLGTLMTRLDASRPIDVLKIDIEGSEEDFLCTKPELLAEVNCLVVELHPTMCDVKRVHEVITRYFSKVTEVEGRRSDKPLLWCVK